MCEGGREGGCTMMVGGCRYGVGWSVHVRVLVW